MTFVAHSSLVYPPATPQDCVELLPLDHPTHTVADPYRWLEDASSPQTQQWQQAQDDLAAQVLGALPGRQHLRQRLNELMRVEKVGAPFWYGQRGFQWRFAPEDEHYVLWVLEPDGSERVLLDPHEIDPSGATVVESIHLNWDGSLLAYLISEGGTEHSLLWVKDVTTGEHVEGPIDRMRYASMGWLQNNHQIYYTRMQPSVDDPRGGDPLRSRIWLHTVGITTAEDTLVFGDGRHDEDPGYQDGEEPRTCFNSVAFSREGKWLIAYQSTGGEGASVWLGNIAEAPTQPRWQQLQSSTEKISTELDFARDGRMLVFTNLDAPRNRLLVADPHQPERENWRELIPEDPEAVLATYAILDGPELGDHPQLVCVWTRHAVSEFTVHDLMTGKWLPEATATLAQLPPMGNVGNMNCRQDGGHELWFEYSTTTMPWTVYCYNAVENSCTVWATPPNELAIPQVHAQLLETTSADGTLIRVVVISGQPQPDRPRPTALYGYGGFGISMGPGFSPSDVAWVEAGGVCAIAQLRGGSEEGEDWHRAGMREHKNRVFEDFIAAATMLIYQGWTTPAQLGISGGSNGGLLVGVMLTQRPDMINAVVCSCPLLDMVRYEKFGLGPYWVEEYGTAADPEQLGWLLSYSPYHHVADRVDYPATLFEVFDGDTRVDPLHARKMTAAVQHATSGTRPVILRRQAEVGHSSLVALTRSINLAVDDLAFLGHWTGLLFPACD